MDSEGSLTCGFCGRGVEAERLCGRLICQNSCVAHLHCMQYSSNLVQYKLSTFGGFLVDEVQTEIRRGKLQTCDVCKKAEDTGVVKTRGATCSCAVSTCQATFHYPCAKQSAITVRLVDDQTNDVIHRVFCSEKHKEQFNNPNKVEDNSPTDVRREMAGHTQAERSHSTPRSFYHACRARKKCFRRTRSEVYDNKLPYVETSAASIPEDANVNMNAWHPKVLGTRKRYHDAPSHNRVKSRKRTRHLHQSPESDSDVTESSGDDCYLDSFDISLAGTELSTTDDSGRNPPIIRRRSRGRGACVHNAIVHTQRACDGHDDDTSDSVDGEEAGWKAGKRRQKKRSRKPYVAICECHAMDVSCRADHLGKMLFKRTPCVSAVEDFATINLCNSSSSCPFMDAADHRLVLGVIRQKFTAKDFVDKQNVVNEPRIVCLDEPALQPRDNDSLNLQHAQRVDDTNLDEQLVSHNDDISLEETLPQHNDQNSLDELQPRRNEKNIADEHSNDQSPQRHGKTGSVEQPTKCNKESSFDEHSRQCHGQNDSYEQLTICNHNTSLDEQSLQRHGKNGSDKLLPKRCNKNIGDQQPRRRHGKNGSDEQLPKRNTKNILDEQSLQCHDKNGLGEQLPKHNNVSSVDDQSKKDLNEEIAKRGENSHLHNRTSSQSNSRGSGTSWGTGCYLCHYVGGMKKRIEAMCTQPQKECLLCFIESDTNALTDQQKNDVKNLAEEIYSVVPKHIIVWVPKVDDVPVASDNIIYLIRDIANALREHSSPDLERLVFGLSQNDIDTYDKCHQLHESFGGERQELVQTMMHDVIKEDLSTVKSGNDVNVGTLCKVSQTSVYMLYLHVCDATDPVHRMRSRLCHKQQSIFLWSEDTRLTNIGTFSAKAGEYFREREADELQFWLERNAEPEISYYEPKIETVTCDHPGSAIFQLKKHFQLHYKSSPYGMSTLVFLGPIDYAESTAATCVAQWMPEVLGEVLTSVRDVFIVLGIDVSHAACNLSDLTPALQDNVLLTVYSFADPGHLPVTCVLLHFQMHS